MKFHVLRKKFPGLWALSVLILLQGCGDATQYSRNPSTGAETWEHRDQGIRIKLTQIPPDQLNGFYQGRGFDPKSAQIIADACVFQTELHNEHSTANIELNLADWRILLPSGEQGLKLKRHWQKQWSARGISSDARLAFQWALFPTTQNFKPGDWNMGMTVYGLPAATQFDLRVIWQSGNKTRSTVIKDIRCHGEAKKPAKAAISKNVSFKQRMTSVRRDLAPGLSLKTPKGKLINIKDLVGKVVLVNFWATWCPPCRKEMPSMQRLYDKMDKHKFTMLAVNMGEDEDLVFEFTFSLDTPLTFPLLLDHDGRVTRQWKVRGLPTTYIVDKQGYVVYRAIGGREWDDPNLVKIIETLISQ